MLKSIKIMFDKLEESDIIYCHWKSNEHLREALEGDTDLDVLFLPEQRMKLDVVLNTCGLKRFRATPLMQYNAIEDYIGFDKETAKIWHLHTHYRMTLGEKHLKGYTVTPWGYRILENRIKSEYGIYTSSYEDELILFYVRNAMKLRLRDIGKKIASNDIAELNWLLIRIQNSLIKERVKELLGNKASDEIIRLTKLNLIKKSQLRKLQSILIDELKVFTGNSSLSSWLLSGKREIFWFIGAVVRHFGINSNNAYRRVSPSGGSVIVFLGSDGAGKSTTISYVKKELAKKMDVKTIYLGSGDGSSSLLRKPMKVIAKRVSGKGLKENVAKEYRAKNGISFKAKLYNLAKIIWAYTLAIEKKSKLREITKARNNGIIVLVDRYPQTVYPGLNDGPLLTRYLDSGKGILYKLAKRELAIYSSAYLNTPDLTLKLVVPTEVAIKRKPEMTVEEIEKKKEIVMLMTPSRNIRIIDTSVDIKESLGNVMNEIWKII